MASSSNFITYIPQKNLKITDNYLDNQRFQNNKDKAKLNEEILSVHGQSSGIMLKYLYMLSGDVNTCKPDRWLHRFLQTFYPEIQLNDIQSLMTDTVAELKKYRPEVTVRMLDNAIWKYASQMQ